MSLKTGLRFRRKSGDPWVSTNRVLNGLGKRLGNGVGRNPNFDTDETKLLIQLWGDPKVQRALITTHKKHAVILQLAQKMQDFGYFRSAEEITTRIKNLKCFYNRIKKDIESGQESSTKPSWKHFDEMDAIMTRPIFSVRPDEVPAPSLKFRLEQAREERAERRKKIQNEGILSADPTAEDSQDFLDEDSVDGMDEEPVLEDNLIPDVEVDMDISETFAAITQDENAQDSDNNAKSADTSDMDKSAEMKEEQNSNSTASLDKSSQNKKEETEAVEAKTAESNDTSLLEPKQEPIDVDAEDETNKSNNAIVSQLLSLSAPTSKVSTANSTTVVTSTTATSSTTTGKISLVPTNFLMQPSKTINSRVATATPVASSPSTAVAPQQFQLLTSNSQMQPRFIFSGATTSTAEAGIINAGTGGIVGTGPGGMKILLLSSEQAAAGSSSTAGFPKSLGTFMPLNTANMVQIQNLAQQTTPVTLQATPQKTSCIPSPNVPVETGNKTEEKLVNKTVLKKKTQKTEAQSLLQQKTQFFQKHRQENPRPTATQQQEAPFTKKDATNLRILLRQLLNAQYESNAINSRRWKLERDRLEFEKTFAERCLNAIPNVVDQLKQVFKPQTDAKQQQEQETQTPAQKPAPTQIFQATPFMTMSSSGSNIRLQPPKLLFTTVRHPTLLTAQNALSLSSPALTPISSKLVTVTPAAATTTQTVTINDTELVTPKEEPNDE